MIHRLPIIVAILSVGVSPAALAEPVFRYARKISVPEHEQQELVSVALDADVFAATRDGYPDLRIIDDAGEPVAYLLRQVMVQRTRKVKNTWTARNPTVKPTAGGGLEITLRLGAKQQQPDGLCLVSPLRNFQHRVRVESSADGQTFSPVSDSTIFDYSRYMDVRNDCVSLPPSGDRHFRITIDDVTADQESELLELTRRLRGGEETETTERVTIDRRPFRIEKIEFWTNVESHQNVRPRQAPSAIEDFQVKEKADEDQTIITVDVRRQPLTSFTIEAATKNFSRHATVDAKLLSGVRADWHTLGEATVSRIDFRRLQRENLKIALTESRGDQYRIVVDNRDSRPLEITGVTAEQNVYELVFLTSPERAYRLVYGVTDMEAADYDTTAIKTLLGEGYEPASASLESQVENTEADRAAPWGWSRLFNDKRLLVPIIVVLVLLLGWGLFQASKRLDHVD